MKVADYVIQYLRDIGITKVFVVYGAACGDLIDAFTRIRGIEYVCMFHEQACSFATETYAKVTNNPSVCIATSGPGGINLLNGIANCYYDSTPCVFITGQINSKFLKPSPMIRQIGFQENDIVAMASPVTKFATMIKSPNQVIEVLNDAVSTAISGRPGPVLIDIPIDIQKAEITPTLPSVLKTAIAFEDRVKAQGEICEFYKDLQKAKRPVLLIGGGVRLAGAVDTLQLLIKRLKIPTIPTWNAIDIVCSDNAYYRGRIGTFGSRGGNFTIQNSDLLLSIGCRMSGRITGGNVPSFARNAKKYIVDIDRANLFSDFQQVKGDVNIYADANQFITWLYNFSGYNIIPDFTEWLGKTKGWNEKYPTFDPIYYNETKRVNPYVFIKTLSEELTPDDIVVVDCGGNVVNTYQAFKTKYGQRVISSHGNSPMGYSFAGAIGACLAKPNKRVICIIGDGGFNMNIQELQTLKNYNINNLKVFILNNQIYGITQQFQDTHFEGRYEACGPKGYNPPDFLEIVKAYGVPTFYINNQQYLKAMIRLALGNRNSVVCDVNCKGWHIYEPRVVGWNTPIEDLSPLLSREELKENIL